MKTKWRASVSIFLIALFFTFFEIAHVDVNTSSMAPTLNPGDYFLSSRLNSFGRYNIVELDDPEDDQKILVKRIVGLPGETIQMFEGTVFVNGRIVAEPYLSDAKQKGSDLFPAYPERFPTPISVGNYFVLGDNRDISRDSRSFGPVYQAHFHGKVLFVFWPFKDAKIFWNQ